MSREVTKKTASELAQAIGDALWPPDGSFRAAPHILAQAADALAELESRATGFEVARRVVTAARAWEDHRPDTPRAAAEVHQELRDALAAAAEVSE